VAPRRVRWLAAFCLVGAKWERPKSRAIEIRASRLLPAGMQSMGKSSARESSPPGAPFRSVAACLLCGAVLPALVYGASRSGAVPWIWGLPDQAGSARLAALGLAGAFALLLLAGADVLALRISSVAASRALTGRGLRRAPADHALLQPGPGLPG
jgi:hypothetical protein